MRSLLQVGQSSTNSIIINKKIGRLLELPNTWYNGIVGVVDDNLPVFVRSAAAARARRSSCGLGAQSCDTTVSCAPLKTGIVGEQLLQFSNNPSCYVCLPFKNILRLFFRDTMLMFPIVLNKSVLGTLQLAFRKLDLPVL